VTLPLDGLRVLEFSHTIMGPCAGMALADLGADVIKVEPAPEGDHTRRLPGFAAGFFPFFNRNKRSLAVDLKNHDGRALVLKLARTADVVIENYAPRTMERLGVGWETLRATNPRLVYLALKGFLSGPYEERPALDEVVQFMAGLAYMTGPPGRPLRAGASIIDILGGTYGIVGVLAALRERERTGLGKLVRSSLFESGVLLMGQNMAGEVMSGKPMPPMPARVGAWGVYEPFDTADGEQVFLGITSDNHWRRFCLSFARPDLLGDLRLASNSARVSERAWLVPRIAEIMKRFTKAELIAIFEREAIPFAPVAKTVDLFTDPHLLSGGKLLDIALGHGLSAKLPALPLELDGETLGLRRQAPRLGEHTTELLAELRIGEGEIKALAYKGVIVAG
jgi:crotonobetainyl-CoA:carnitine CoA-transferase CaiB-like acyl-CoA transferase